MGDNQIFYIFIFVIIGAIYGYAEENFILGDEYEKGITTNGATLVGADGHEIKLLECKNATDVSYADVITFIRADHADKNAYTPNYQCGDFAESVQHNAEVNGINCGIVVIDGINHACNVFNTTDRGLVFVDCTHGYGSGSFGESWDSTVNIEVGKQYKPRPIKSCDAAYDSMGVVTSYEIYW
jgi:hypothetical protein